MTTSTEAGGFAPRLKRLGSETLVYGLSAIVGRFLAYLLQPYYAHEFTPAEAGIPGVVYPYISILSILLYLGMDIAYMRNTAARDASHVEQQRAFSMSFGAILGIGGVATLTGFAAARWLAPIARLDTTSFRLMMAIVFTDALLSVPYAHLRMAHKAVRYAAFRVFFVVVSIALNILLISYLHWGVTAIFVANVVGNVAVLALFVGDIASLFRPALMPGGRWRALWAYALPVIPATLAVIVVENGDLITLNYLSTKAIVGIYNFNYKLGAAMLLFVQMFRLAWTPFSLQHAREPRAPELYSRVLTGLMLVCTLVFLGVAIFLPSLVAVPAVYAYVKPEYWQGLPIVPVILLGYVFSGMYAVVTAGLYIERKTHVLAWIATVGAIVNVGICILAAPGGRMVSVACATPAAYALMAALGAWQSHRVYPVPFEWGRLLVLGVFGALLFGADQWLAWRGLPPGSIAGIASKTGLFVALPALLLATGFFRHGEMRALRALVSRRTGSA